MGSFRKDLPSKRKGGVILQRWGQNAKVGSNRKEGGVKTQRTVTSQNTDGIKERVEKPYQLPIKPLKQ